ncbi:hypothetical protein [Pseudorhodoferax sp. Leaf274]|uniref:hypothetical protein n=1 Tax=Pseudorhodoferax sp. Leaf274 TaxID=1736318 RepID=UPI0012E1F5FB|nr:hypothetical protein [Pseudorhodoferax sp. Leaf274]
MRLTTARAGAGMAAAAVGHGTVALVALEAIPACAEGDRVANARQTANQCIADVLHTDEYWSTELNV